MNRDTILKANELPLRYTSFTNCFRSEAGASGKDTKGLMREHQFGKVEIVSITHPDESTTEFDRMISCVESILKKLDLPYRLVELCSGDLGFFQRIQLILKFGCQDKINLGKFQVVLTVKNFNLEE